jgi:hypothetical protein
MNQGLGPFVAAAGVLALLGTAAGAKDRPVAPQVAPRVMVIPQRPYPPLGAPSTFVVPPRGADGVRETVNARLTPDQTLLNLRSAYNVAALGCLRPVHAEILVGYKSFLITHSRELAASNRAADAEFRRRYGAGFFRRRELYLTQVYNYFANPSTLSGFCDAALAMSRAGLKVPAGQLAGFSAVELPKLEAVFETFFQAFEQYRMDAANWDERYSPRPAMVLPGRPAGPVAATRR